jgi:hypothetical protein
MCVGGEVQNLTISVFWDARQRGLRGGYQYFGCNWVPIFRKIKMQAVDSSKTLEIYLPNYTISHPKRP